MQFTIRSAAGLCALTLSLGMAHASGPVAVYALIDSVKMEPAADHPERIVISGIFITAEERTDIYSAPQRGFLYFKLPAQNSEMALREWADLKSVAGTRQVVGFGSSWFGKARVRKPDEEHRNPDPYILGNGVVKINPDHSRARALLDYKDR